MKRLFIVLALLFFSCSKPAETHEEATRAAAKTSMVPLNAVKPEAYRGSLEEVAKRKMLRVIIPSSTDEGLQRDGSPLSFAEDMAEALAAHLAVELELVWADTYRDLLDALDSGYADVAMGRMTITDERRARAAFTQPMDFAQELLAAKEGVDTIASIAVRRSSAYYPRAKAFADSTCASLVEADEKLHTEEILRAVAEGTYDATICDDDFYRAVTAYTDGLKSVVVYDEKRPRGWAVAKGCDSLLAALNGFLRKEALTGHRKSLYTDDLAGIKARKTLRVAVRNNAATYWIHRGKEVGFEYELVQAFAKANDLRLEMVVAPDREQLLQWVVEGRADLAASGITITDSRKEQVRFGKPYLFPQEVIVCRADSSGAACIKSLDDLRGKVIHVRKGSSYEETLLALKDSLGFTIATVAAAVETEEVVSKVASGELAMTLCDDNIARMELAHSAAIAIGPALNESRQIGWAMRPGADSLAAAVDAFFSEGKHKPKGLYYNMLYNRYFKNKKQIADAKSTARFDKSGALSPYDSLMQKAAKAREFDWRLIAAQTYQESEFDPEAKSWVGALGLMQLMPVTAKEMGVANRKDPWQNILGGTGYMRKMLGRFDESIPYRERYFFALASYNAGYGHVLDARRLARHLGYNDSIWFNNVEKAMLLLAKPKYASKAKYGYCRGSEPVTYVKNIDRLYAHYSQSGGQ